VGKNLEQDWCKFRTWLLTSNLQQDEALERIKDKIEVRIGEDSSHWPRTGQGPELTVKAVFLAIFGAFLLGHNVLKENCLDFLVSGNGFPGQPVTKTSQLLKKMDQ
jgi:hypothetical protein